MDSNSFNEFIKERQKILNIKPEQKLSNNFKLKPDFNKSLELIRETQDLKQQKDKHTLAVGTYKKLFWAICVYIILVLSLLTGNKHYFQLDYLVLITLLSTTTANILGVFYIASKWLYETAR
jgi:hypothetical protein